jgi:hypothetical protein
MDPKATLYECQIRIQRAGQNEEIIQDMKNITKKLLTKFYESTRGRKPDKIIMFRSELTPIRRKFTGNDLIIGFNFKL